MRSAVCGLRQDALTRRSARDLSRETGEVFIKARSLLTGHYAFLSLALAADCGPQTSSLALAADRRPHFLFWPADRRPRVRSHAPLCISVPNNVTQRALLALCFTNTSPVPRERSAPHAHPALRGIRTSLRDAQPSRKRFGRSSGASAR
jgi:hypothetical protein